MGTVVTSRFLDSLVMGLFLMILSAMSLFCFGEGYAFLVGPLTGSGTAHWLAKTKVPEFFQKIFRFKRTFQYDLTHILLFALIVAILSMRELGPEVVDDSKGKKKRKLEKAQVVEKDD